MTWHEGPEAIHEAADSFCTRSARRRTVAREVSFVFRPTGRRRRTRSSSRGSRTRVPTADSPRAGRCRRAPWVGGRGSSPRRWRARRNLLEHTPCGLHAQPPAGGDGQPHASSAPSPSIIARTEELSSTLIHAALNNHLRNLPAAYLTPRRPGLLSRSARRRPGTRVRTSGRRPWLEANPSRLTCCFPK